MQQVLFEEFLWDCFRDGCTKRELRLSDDECAVLMQRYPQALCHKQDAAIADKHWYLVSLLPCSTHPLAH